MTGDPVTQPLRESQRSSPKSSIDETLKPSLHALFNGEIYNFKDLIPDARSDSSVILPLYSRLGPKFIRSLDGEFSIVVVDKEKQRALMSTDVFGTKPVFYCAGNSTSHDADTEVPLTGFSNQPFSQLSIATYATALWVAACHRPKQVDPNTAIVFTWTEMANGSRMFTIQETFPVFEFDLRQFKENTGDWQSAFLASVDKRTKYAKSPPFIGLSSGFDSGAIQAALVKLGVPHFSYSIYAREDESTLLARIEYSRQLSESKVVVLSPDEFVIQWRHLAQNAEPFEYTIPGREGLMINDPAACGMSFIAGHVKNISKIYLSGSGADETVSDYGFNGTKIFDHSDFGGKFPEILSDIFPWRSFFLGTQRDYLMKEEMVAGSHGVEGRYPFLDKFLVQEYLWLAVEVKNSLYKRPILDFLQGLAYPILEGKRGFDAADNLRLELRVVDFPKVAAKTSEEDGKDEVETKKKLALAESRLQQVESVLKQSMLSRWQQSLWRLLRLRERADEISDRHSSRYPSIFPTEASHPSGILNVLTCVTDSERLSLGLPTFRIFRETSPFPVINVCSAGTKWAGMSTRLHAIAEFLQDGPQNGTKLYVIADGLDVVFNGLSELEVLNRFESFRKPVVMATEAFCGWGGAQECPQEYIDRFPKVSDEEFAGNRFLNAGASIGRTSDLLRLIQGVISLSSTTNFQSDQRLFFEYYWKNPDSIALDHTQRLFGNLIKATPGPCPNGWNPPCAEPPCCFFTDELNHMHVLLADYSIFGCQVRYRDQDAPLLLHGNGMGKMMFLALIDRLSSTCPKIAKLVLDIEEPGLLTDVIASINAQSGNKENTASWSDAEKRFVSER